MWASSRNGNARAEQLRPESSLLTVLDWGLADWAAPCYCRLLLGAQLSQAACVLNCRISPCGWSELPGLCQLFCPDVVWTPLWMGRGGHLFPLHLPPSRTVGWYLGSGRPSGRRTAGCCRETPSIPGGTGTGKRAQSEGSGNCADRASGHTRPAESEGVEADRGRTEHHPGAMWASANSSSQSPSPLKLSPEWSGTRWSSLVSFDTHIPEQSLGPDILSVLHVCTNLKLDLHS